MNGYPLSGEQADTAAGRLLIDAQLRAGLAGEVFIHGDLDLLLAVRVAFAGSRKASRRSLDDMASLAGGLSRRGACVVSGGAVGTDTAAHAAALAAGETTVIVLPCPIEEIDARSWRRELAPHWDPDRILLLSPFPRGAPTTRTHPIVRNRLIAGLSEAAVAGETGLEGGTNHFLSVARELEIPTFVYRPGRCEPALAAAYEELRRRGASLFTTEDSGGDELPSLIWNAALDYRRDWAGTRQAQTDLFSDPPASDTGNRG